ncbi:MAG: hypothetical protein KKA64_04790 [Nanoarchaeota archaeon]|nr:hypothetical protein [Nanoarchaeota archaeon]
MENKKIAIGFLVLMILSVVPLVRADLSVPPTPGYKDILIYNYIENMEDYPDYIFVSAPIKGPGPSFSMCSITKIDETGLIIMGYKFCYLSVFAIKKSDFDQDKMDLINSESDYEKAQEIFDSIPKKEVVKGIVDRSERVTITDLRTEIKNYYTLDLSKIKTEPDKIIPEKGFTYYLLWLIPILALIAIIIILIKRK